MTRTSAGLDEPLDAPALVQAFARLLERSSETLPAEARQALQSLKYVVRQLKRREDLDRDAEPSSRCCLILEGFMQRYKLLPNGRRQILSFHVPGEIPNLFSLSGTLMDHHLAAICETNVLLITHKDLHALSSRHPSIQRLLWREAFIDSAISREWMVGLGRRSAHERLAHLLCELYARLMAIGLVTGSKCRLPITQTDLADALGLTTVHVNRSLQRLRQDGLLELAGGCLTIEDWRGLTAVAHFDPAYLSAFASRADWDDALVETSSRLVCRHTRAAAGHLQRFPGERRARAV